MKGTLTGRIILSWQLADSRIYEGDVTKQTLFENVVGIYDSREVDKGCVSAGNHLNSKFINSINWSDIRALDKGSLRNLQRPGKVLSFDIRQSTYT